ncbi:MAG TPA: glucuronate isomerase [Bacillota bacterium]|nr:glucuronate isomerase [Bacillota bacterium]
MAQGFLTEEFLLHSETARTLYHDYAAQMPIFDYHCHLPPRDIAENRQFENLTRIWLGGDHYKWRAMRTNGVSERLITGDATDEEKFMAWAGTVPATVRNPLYHWTHLELRRPFGITGRVLNPETAREIYDHCNKLLQTEPFRVRGIMKQMNVKAVCTTDDPVDSLEYHLQIKQDSSFDIKILPAFRPDKAMAVESAVNFNTYVNQLEKVAGMEIKSFSALVAALRKRHDFFHQVGCRLSDHAMEVPYAESYTESEITTIFGKVRQGAALDREEIAKFKSAMLYELALMNVEKNWTMQLHIGALRNNNSRAMGMLGPDTGYDSIADYEIAYPLTRFLDRLDRENKLPKTIIYTLNSKDNDVIATVMGCFQDGVTPGKLQFGSGWWFHDQKDGMLKQMESLSNMGLLSRFVGMLTDSRSFLSYPRHEYFRRILCNLLGSDVERGELPGDLKWLGQIVQDICYNNAVRYFGVEGLE